MEALLPLRGTEWTQGVRRLLASVAQGPGVSGIRSGTRLFDLILDLRYESGMEEYAMLLNAYHGLERFFGELLPENWARRFFVSTLPSMAKLALELPRLVHENLERSRNLMSEQETHLRVLPQQKSGLVFLSQEMSASILVCAFFCMYDWREREELELPSIDFNRFFALIHEKPCRQYQHQKLMCILHYFDRVCENMPQGFVSYERKVLSLRGDTGGSCVHGASFWSNSSADLCCFTVMEEGTIEDHEGEALEVDFANMYLGGGALQSGCVQEEIRFMINPELIAGMLFLPVMDDNEAIEIVGAERYSMYRGYGSTFSFAGDFRDATPRDVWGRRKTRIVAIDAIPQAKFRQYQPDMILREVNKAFCGFLDQELSSMGVATGNWGCGAFGGDIELKSMIQWLAASQAGRPFLVYYSFADQRTVRLQEVVNWIITESWGVAELWHTLCAYGEKRSVGELDSNLFDWLLPK